MKKSILSLLFLGSSTMAFGSLVLEGPSPESGSGLGTVFTLLTLTSPANSSTESGCVGVGLNGVTVTGSSVCATGGGFVGTDAQAINVARTAVSLGITDFNQLRVVFNGSEPPPQGNIFLNKLTLVLFNPTTGAQLGQYSTVAGIAFPTLFSGTGNSGFAFKLDGAQAAAANVVLAASPNLFLGLSANLSSAEGGVETFAVRRVDGTVITPNETVPEPATMALAGCALIALGLSRKFYNRI